jgi:hypothetical protein
METNIIINFQEVGRGMEWTALVQDRERWGILVNAVMYLLVPENARNFSPG